MATDGGVELRDIYTDLVLFTFNYYCLLGLLHELHRIYESFFTWPIIINQFS